jgi:PAS domain S-box-containing protein
VSTTDQEESDSSLKRIFLGLILFWSLAILALAAWNYRQSYTATLEDARTSASEGFRKDVLYRRWASMHGGVYVPVTPQTPPNPYLTDIPERDISTPSGRKLTLINPAYMTRQVHEIGNKEDGSKGHLTSLKLMRPENAADAWETLALQAFERGEKEAASVEEIGGVSYFRFMRPLEVEPGCLNCHAKQDYKVGEIRGGISISVPWARYSASLRSQFLANLGGYCGIWAIGFLGLRLGRKRLQRGSSERKHAEQALREGAEKLRLFADNVPAMTISFDDDLRCLFANKRYAEFFGFDTVSILGKHLREIIGDAAYAEVEGYFAQVLQGHQVTYQRTRPLAGGEIRYLEVKALPRIGEQGKVLGCVAVTTDITERKREEDALRDSEERLRATVVELGQSNAELKLLNDKLAQSQGQLLQSEKMAAVGQLAAGVAHEINNPIGFVNSNLGTLKDYVERLLVLVDNYERSAMASSVAQSAELQAARKDADLPFLRDDVVALLAESRDGLERVKKIVQDLRDFSRIDSGEWNEADLNAGLESTLNVARNELKYKSEVIKKYGELPPVRCHLGQINQVFLNLLVNAAQAIEGRGDITLSSGVEGPWVWVSVEDTGKGMTPEVLKRIFEPFFTTKPVGKGTGLGLSLAYDIVKNHGGRIDVASEPGRGTRFQVWLPVAGPENTTP